MKRLLFTTMPLDNATNRLQHGWLRYQQNTSDVQIRDGLMLRLKITYEISHKMLKRYLEMASATPELFEQMPFQDLVRTGNEQGLLVGSWPDWRLYREMRGKTSHSYDEAVALEVVAGIPKFLAEASYLSEQLQKRMA
ncbi:HI0074 family nucleotidyltransferase substrate-binding subunit [Rheinheimera soli]|uniref:Nucleotidyltransferase substrate binding protein (TIGR01987 family) n=1 Tax=Rheinheimera soli TaxID=443616 RepID=A0ABU1W2Z6_9GAMM|nr:HI0074 family nucleotidyltransferase substrate-binding subunit [Rheinheimera soli]MDR7122304.1 nucleotidyltransferase substrate binding protein (TIGR01987 family) [Rheinheimera soli]